MNLDRMKIFSLLLCIFKIEKENKNLPFFRNIRSKKFFKLNKNLFLTHSEASKTSLKIIFSQIPPSIFFFFSEEIQVNLISFEII